jgi:hypothetical protein
MLVCFPDDDTLEKQRGPTTLSLFSKPWLISSYHQKVQRTVLSCLPQDTIEPGTRRSSGAGVARNPGMTAELGRSVSEGPDVSRLRTEKAI